MWFALTPGPIARKTTLPPPANCFEFDGPLLEVPSSKVMMISAPGSNAWIAGTSLLQERIELRDRGLLRLAVVMGILAFIRHHEVEVRVAGCRVEHAHIVREHRVGLARGQIVVDALLARIA